MDSLDTDQARCAEHGLAEIEAAYPRLRHRSLVVCDDTVYRGNAFHGKGALLVPWLMSRGCGFSTPGIRRFCLCERDALGGRYGVAPKVVKSQEMTVEASSSDPGRRSPAVRLGSDRACANSSALRTSGGATVRVAIKGL